MIVLTLTDGTKAIFNEYEVVSIHQDMNGIMIVETKSEVFNVKETMHEIDLMLNKSLHRRTLSIALWSMLLGAFIGAILFAAIQKI